MTVQCALMFYLVSQRHAETKIFPSLKKKKKTCKAEHSWVWLQMCFPSMACHASLYLRIYVLPELLVPYAEGKFLHENNGWISVSKFWTSCSNWRIWRIHQFRNTAINPSKCNDGVRRGGEREVFSHIPIFCCRVPWSLRTPILPVDGSEH